MSVLKMAGDKETNGGGGIAERGAWTNSTKLALLVAVTSRHLKMAFAFARAMGWPQYRKISSQIGLLRRGPLSLRIVSFLVRFCLKELESPSVVNQKGLL
jgi:hypothetical protein